MKEKISKLRRINLVKTFLLRIRKISVGRVFVMKNAEVSAAASARIVAEKGTFEFGKKWTPQDPFPSLLSLGKNASVIIKGTFLIYSGSRVYVNKGAVLTLGEGYINHNLNLSCFQRIDIGRNVVISENVTIRDSDNHEIVGSGKAVTSPVTIGNDVWIGMNVTILKGVSIGDGSVIAAGAVVRENIPAHCLAAGVPAKVIKEGILWK